MERESIEMDVLFVGAGPANLSGAFHLARLVKGHNEAVAKGERQGKPLGDIEIAVIEKGATVGSHILRRGVDPRRSRSDADFVSRARRSNPLQEDYFFTYKTRPSSRRSRRRR